MVMVKKDIKTLLENQIFALNDEISVLQNKIDQLKSINLYTNENLVDYRVDLKQHIEKCKHECFVRTQCGLLNKEKLENMQNNMTTIVAMAISVPLTCAGLSLMASTIVMNYEILPMGLTMPMALMFPAYFLVFQTNVVNHCFQFRCNKINKYFTKKILIANKKIKLLDEVLESRLQEKNILDEYKNLLLKKEQIRQDKIKQYNNAKQ